MGPNIVSHGSKANKGGSRGSQYSRGSNRGAGKLPQINPSGIKTSDIGLENLSEEDQWNAINKYNTYLFNQEQKLERVKELEKRKQMRLALDAQKREKARRGDIQNKKKQDYIDAEAELLNYENRMEEKRQ